MGPEQEREMKENESIGNVGFGTDYQDELSTERLSLISISLLF